MNFECGNTLLLQYDVIKSNCMLWNLQVAGINKSELSRDGCKKTLATDSVKAAQLDVDD